MFECGYGVPSGLRWAAERLALHASSAHASARRKRRWHEIQRTGQPRARTPPTRRTRRADRCEWNVDTRRKPARRRKPDHARGSRRNRWMPAETMSNARKTMNTKRAICVAAPAMPVKPRSAAIRATTRNVKTQRSMVSEFQQAWRLTWPTARPDERAAPRASNTLWQHARREETWCHRRVSPQRPRSSQHHEQRRHRHVRAERRRRAVLRRWGKRGTLSWDLFRRGRVPPAPRAARSSFGFWRRTVLIRLTCRLHAPCSREHGVIPGSRRPPPRRGSTGPYRPLSAIAHTSRRGAAENASGQYRWRPAQDRCSGRTPTPRGLVC